MGLEKLTKTAGRLYGIGGVGPLVHVDTAPKAFIIGIRLGAGEPMVPR